MAYDPVKSKAYYVKNAEKLRARAAAWKATHPEYQKAYDRSIREKTRMRTAEWRAANPELAKSRRRAHYDENKDKVKMQHRVWAKANPIKMHEYEKSFRKNHREKYHAKREALRLKSEFGITIDDYNRMLMEQGGVCAICERPERSKFNGKVCKLSVDHCHRTGFVRGLLCFDCNSSIGRMGDDPVRLDAAAHYLRSAVAHIVSNPGTKVRA